MAQNVSSIPVPKGAVNVTRKLKELINQGAHITAFSVDTPPNGNVSYLIVITESR